MTEEQEYIDELDEGNCFIDGIVLLSEYAKKYNRELVYCNESFAIFIFKKDDFEIFEVVNVGLFYEIGYMRKKDVVEAIEHIENILPIRLAKRSYLADHKLRSSYLMNLINRREVFDKITKKHI